MVWDFVVVFVAKLRDGVPEVVAAIVIDVDVDDTNTRVRLAMVGWERETNNDLDLIAIIASLFPCD